jgi:hypothetical protein
MGADQIRSALSCGRPGCDCSKGGVKTHCPGPSHARGDQHPSLGVTDKDGRVLVRCYGGCEQSDIIAELQNRDLWPRPEPHPSSNGKAPIKIVATYDYLDEGGALAFQVVRLEPKDFRQRRPDGKGGWIWKKGDTNIVYRLPGLLAADPAALVFVCEGEKDADRLAGLGLVATTRAEGAGKWTDANSRWLEGRRVAILGDNDAAGAKDVDRKVRSIGQAASAVAVVDLAELPEGGDVSDWLDAGKTKDDLVALAEMAMGATPSAEPRTLPSPSLASFPTEILPSSMRGLIASASKAMLVPPEFVGVPLLVLAGAVIGNSWEIELKGGWKEGPNLYAAIVGDPGAKKTPALKMALRAIHEIQQRLSADYRGRKAAYDEEKALWERTPKKERGAPPEPPGYQHVWTADATTEALAGMLSGSKGLALIRDELVGWVKSMDAYRSGGKGADRQNYLSMWSRSPIKIDRKSSPEPIIVARPCLSVFGGIQPDVLPDLVEHASRDDGFIDRLLFSYPDIGSDHWTNEGIDEASQAAVERLFSGLYDLVGAEMPSGDVVPRVARLGPAAMALWGQWYDANAAEQRDERLPSSLKGTWAKLPSQLARLALILHVGHAVDAGQSVPAIIAEHTVADAADLVEYFKEHARAALGELRTPRSTLEDRVLQGLRDRGPSTARTVHREILRESVKLDRLKSTLERLLEDGRVKATDAPSGARGGRPTRLWEAAEDDPKAKAGGRRPMSFPNRGAG